MQSFYKIKRAVSFVLAMIFMLSLFSFLPINAAENSAGGSGKTIKDGVYRIKNVATEKYLDTFDTRYDSLGRAYLENYNGSSGQSFLIKKQEDGTYMFYVQNEDSECALGCTGNDYIAKNDIITNREKFDIFYVSNGKYTIAPAYSDKASAVLEASDERSNYGNYYVKLGTYNYSENQQWELTEVLAESLYLSNNNLTVKPYTLGNLYVTLSPSYLTEKVEWTSSDESVIMVDKDGSFCALKEGKATVTATCDGKSDFCNITVGNARVYTWYSQHNMYSGGWNALPLSNLYFSSGGVYKPFFINRYTSLRDWMDQGCLLCSISMLLKNMNAVLENGYDIRTGRKGNLEADPYTVALANVGSAGATSFKQTIYGNPVSIVQSRICTAFNVNGKHFNVEKTSYVTKQMIKEALDKHPEGVIVGFSRFSGDSHYVLFVKCINPGETNPNNYQFKVCDSAAYDRADGDNILFEDSFAYTVIGDRYYHMVSMQVWNLDN